MVTGMGLKAGLKAIEAFCAASVKRSMRSNGIRA
jgi:hypothetical protein